MAELLLLIWLTASLVSPVRSFAHQTTEPSVPSAGTSVDSPRRPTPPIVIVGGGESLRFCVSFLQTALTPSCALTRIIENIQEHSSKANI